MSRFIVGRALQSLLEPVRRLARRLLRRATDGRSDRAHVVGDGDQEDAARLRAHLGLDKPITTQYACS
jgi:hypothetical protein